MNSKLRRKQLESELGIRSRHNNNDEVTIDMEEDYLDETKVVKCYKNFIFFNTWLVIYVGFIWLFLNVNLKDKNDNKVCGKIFEVVQ